MASGFIIAKLVAVYGGPTGLAVLGQFQSFITSMTGVVSAASGAGLVRYTAENESKKYIRCLLWWRACTYWTSIILAIVMPLLYVFSTDISKFLSGDEEYAYLINIFSLSLPFVVLTSYINSTLNGHQQYKAFIKLGMISVFITLCLMMFFTYAFGISGALIAVAIQGSVIGIILFLLSIKQPWMKCKYWVGRTKGRYKHDVAKYIMMAITSALTAPLALICVRNILVDNSGWALTGQWQAVWKISEVYLSIITVALSVYYLPRLSKLKGYEPIKREIFSVAKFLIPLVIFLAFLVYISRDFAISLLFTSDFNDARNYFAIQLVGDVVKIAGWLLAFPMLARGASKWFIFTEVFFSCLFVLLAFFFIKYYGVHGANLAYLINFVLYFLFLFVNFKRFAK
ncbi:O-antigen translocase [Colwellia sp. MB3u-22]|nr:O-antigen translocase [Colwellia sp. MB02u-7]MBA6236577.1 O-antigen translocase [Colwellia sp. MB02u-11]MBA6298024.1 O-antigen translocase [Colwellia sp. MB3u-22]MBA6312152.1 O-antigen translocase [Colwellia sp. MB3u-64]